jgi:hypothetical protein
MKYEPSPVGWGRPQEVTMERKLPSTRTTPKVRLTKAEQREVDEHFAAIRDVMKKKDIDIANVIGLVTAEEVRTTTDQVKVKFAEETVAQMNMLAFD